MDPAVSAFTFPRPVAIDPAGACTPYAQRADGGQLSFDWAGDWAKVSIGAGADGAASKDGKAFSADGRDGIISVVSHSGTGQFTNVETIQTLRGARTVPAAAALHERLSAAADFQPEVAQAGQAPHRPEAIPGPCEGRSVLLTDAACDRPGRALFQGERKGSAQ
jgi:hypothetical protein